MRSALATGGIYVITDRRLTPGKQLLPAVSAAIRGGAGLVQYRDKTEDQHRRKREASALLELCRQYAVPLIINDDVELAAEIGADGVHLGRDDADAVSARRALGPQGLVGISGYADPLSVLTPDADYIAFGRLFDSPTKPQASPVSLEVFRQAQALGNKTLVGIGGITAGNAPWVINAGAHWLAVVSAAFAAPDIEKATRHLCQVIAQQI